MTDNYLDYHEPVRDCARNSGSICASESASKRVVMEYLVGTGAHVGHDGCEPNRSSFQIADSRNFHDRARNKMFRHHTHG